MSRYVSAVRWWVLVPLASVFLEPYFDFVRRSCFSLHFDILGRLFGGMALVSVVIDLPAIMLGLGLFGRSAFTPESSWFLSWLLIQLVPSLVFSGLLYVACVAVEQLWTLCESKLVPGRAFAMVLAVFFSLCVICLLMAFGAAAASVSADIFPRQLAAIPWFPISLFFAAITVIFAVVRWYDARAKDI